MSKKVFLGCEGCVCELAGFGDLGYVVVEIYTDVWFQKENPSSRNISRNDGSVCEIGMVFIHEHLKWNDIKTMVYITLKKMISIIGWIKPMEWGKGTG